MAIGSDYLPLRLAFEKIGFLRHLSGSLGFLLLSGSLGFLLFCAGSLWRFGLSQSGREIEWPWASI